MAAKKTGKVASKKTGKEARVPRPRAPGRPKPPGVEATDEEVSAGTDVTRPAVPMSIPETLTTKLGVATDIRTAHREFAAAMNKNGQRLVAMADEAPNTYELRRPTGIMPLDIDIGGGFPAGGLSIIAGPDNAGKTWLMMRAMAMHQRLYGERSSLAIALAEGALDYKRAMQSGLVLPIPDEIISEWNQERLQLGLPGYTQQDVLWFKREVGGVQILRANNGDELMHLVLEAVRYNKYNIIGVDSFSILLPEIDEAKDVGQRGAFGANANLMTDFIKKYTPYTSGLNEINPTTVIGIMQVRANTGKANAPAHMQKYIKDYIATGAWAVKHGKLVDLQIWDGEKLKKTVHGQTQVYGKDFHWRTEKGKAGCHDNVQGQTEFRYDIPQGHDDLWSIIVSGMARGVFREERGRVEIYHPITHEKTSLGGFPGLPAFARVMSDDFEFELQMRLYVLAAFGVQCLYRPLS